MSHLVAFPEDMYQAIAKYAAEHGQTAEDVIFAWGKDVVTFVTSESNLQGASEVEMQRVNNPEYDPWAGFHGAFTASPSDLIKQHDKYLAEELLDDHTSE